MNASAHPLQRPMAANQVWSMDFVFDRTAEGRSIKSLTVVDDATHEAVAIVAERAMGGNQLVRVLDQLAITRGLPKAIQTDNGKEFCGRTMLNWAQARGVQLFLIEPSKPNQNVYIESFNGRFREECLNEHWFTSLAHARVILEAWRRDYNEERPKRSLGGLTPAAHAQRLAQKPLNSPRTPKPCATQNGGTSAAQYDAAHRFGLAPARRAIHGARRRCGRCVQSSDALAHPAPRR